MFPTKMATKIKKLVKKTVNVYFDGLKLYEK